MPEVEIKAVRLLERCLTLVSDLEIPNDGLVTYEDLGSEIRITFNDANGVVAQIRLRKGV